MEQFCSSEIKSGNVFFSLLDNIFVSILQSRQSRDMSLQNFKSFRFLFFEIKVIIA